MTAERHRIAQVVITPVAFAVPPLLSAVGLHQPFALRAVLEVTTDSGVTGLGESHGDAAHLARLHRAGHALLGVEVFDRHELAGRVGLAVAADDGDGGTGTSGTTGSGAADRVLAPFEVALLDLQGRILDRSVSDLLGGRVRDRVPFSGHLFPRWAGHPGQGPDAWGAALDPDAIVEQARRMLAEYGFGALTLQGGVFAPDQEIETVLALRDAFPGLPLRLDPDSAWSVETAIRAGQALDGVLEYLVDPTPGRPGTAEVASKVTTPLATGRGVASFDDVEDVIRADAVRVILADHHVWGGLHRSQLLAGLGETFGLGLSMRSDPHLGISLAAMVQLAGATPALDLAADTPWPWKAAGDDVIVPGAIGFADGMGLKDGLGPRDGTVGVPAGPGLGVELDPQALARLHEQYLTCGVTTRDDADYRQRVEPGYRPVAPRW